MYRNKGTPALARVPLAISAPSYEELVRRRGAPCAAYPVRR
jgi:hypothetical protein